MTGVKINRMKTVQRLSTGPFAGPLHGRNCGAPWHSLPGPVPVVKRFGNYESHDVLRAE